MYQRILVATDGSDLSNKAVGSALELAALCKAELLALKVVPRYPHSYFEGGIALQPDEVARVEKQWADEGQAVSDPLRESRAECRCRPGYHLAMRYMVVEHYLRGPGPVYEAELTFEILDENPKALCSEADASGMFRSSSFNLKEAKPL